MKQSIPRFLLAIVSFLPLWGQAAVANEWTPPRFVKEWEVKEIKPGLYPWDHRVLSMTANKHGVFVLVEAREEVIESFDEVWAKTPAAERERLVQGVSRTVFGFDIPSREDEMAMAEHIKQFPDYAKYIKLGVIPEEEKEEMKKFIRKYFIPPEKVLSLPELERQKVLDYINEKRDKYYPERDNLEFLKKDIERMGRDAYLKQKSERIRKYSRNEIFHYRIQRYDADGRFISEWPKDNRLKLSEEMKKRMPPDFILLGGGREGTMDTRESLFGPGVLASDGKGDLYLADYGGNKVVKFDASGNVLGIWKIYPRHRGTGIEGIERGMSVVGNRVYVSYMGFGHPTLRHLYATVTVTTLGGVFVGKKEFLRPKVPGVFVYSYPARKIPFAEAEFATAEDMAVDRDGNFFFLLNLITVAKYGKDTQLLKAFEPILKEGFDTGVTVVDPKTQKRVPYERWAVPLLGRFDSQRGSGFQLEKRLYTLGKLYISPRDELFVTFVGSKPFGVMNAVIYDREGRYLGYWKAERKSMGAWFEGLAEFEKLSTKEMEVSLAFEGESIFVAKTIEFSPGSTYGKGSGGRVLNSVVQRFDR